MLEYFINMSDTPRTDEELDHINNVYHDWVCRPIVKVDEDKCVVDAKFAKQLEIELNAANQHIKRLKEAGTYVINTLQPKDPSNLSFLQSQAIKEWNDVKQNKE